MIVTTPSPKQPGIPPQVYGTDFDLLMMGYYRIFDSHLLGGADSCESVVRWVAEDDEDRCFSLHFRGRFSLVLEFVEAQAFLGTRRGLPVCERVREVDSYAFVGRVQERSSHRLEEEAELQVRDNKRRWHDLEAEDPCHRCLLDIICEQCVRPSHLYWLVGAISRCAVDGTIGCAMSATP